MFEQGARSALASQQPRTRPLAVGALQPVPSNRELKGDGSDDSSRLREWVDRASPAVSKKRRPGPEAGSRGGCLLTLGPRRPSTPEPTPGLEPGTASLRGSRGACRRWRLIALQGCAAAFSPGGGSPVLPAGAGWCVAHPLPRVRALGRRGLAIWAHLPKHPLCSSGPRAEWGEDAAVSTGITDLVTPLSDGLSPRAAPVFSLHG
jgi:hypothetical protein